MKLQSTKSLSFFLLLTAMPSMAGSTVPSLAEAQPAVTESGWEVRTTLYGWGTMLDGDVTVRGISAPVDVSFGDILNQLDYAVMGTLEIGRGKWSLMADLFIAQLGADGSKGNIDYETQLNQFTGNFTVIRNIIDDSRTRFDVFAGARVNSMDIDLDIETNKIGTFSGSQGKTWVDPIIGARFQQEMPNGFFIRALADIGGFGLSSDLTWQALAALGYHINDAASVALGYRGLGTDYESGDFGYDVISHGLLLGFEYKF